MIKSICIIELDFHPECLYGLTKIMDQLNWTETIHITVITRIEIFETICDVISKNSIDWKLCQNKLSHAKCILSHLSIIRMSDLIFINTISQSIHAYLPLKGKIIILRIHNINKLFAPLSSIIFPLTTIDFVKLIKFIIKECIIQNYFSDLKKFQQLVKIYAFPEPEMMDYALKKYINLSNENSFLLPLKSLSHNFLKKNRNLSKEITFSIVGYLNPYFKDIQILKNVLTKIEKNELNIKIHINFIGCGKNLKFINSIKNIKNKKIHFHFLEKRVNQKEYNILIEKSDCIICPIKHKFHVGVFKEFYGQTKITGILSDIAINPTPLIMPSFYFKNEDIVPGIMKYQNEDELYHWIKRIIEEPNILNEKQKEIEETAQMRYGLPKINTLYSKLIKLSI